MLKIVQAPHDVLTTPAKRVEKFDKALNTLLEEIKDALERAKDPEGVGLAAPQVGKPFQIFIVKPTEKAKIQIFINPTLKTLGELPNRVRIDDEREDVKLEGCLSLKDIWGIVTRYEKVHIDYQDETGGKHSKEFSGFLATILQHEYDHIQGILFPKRVLEQSNKLYKSRKDKKGEVVFDEIKL
jgi:peptide deformylase